MLLSKYRMRHRDPKLFYLTMDIYIKRTGIPLKRTLTLDDEARPAELKTCHPWGECKFTLQMRKGGLGKLEKASKSLQFDLEVESNLTNFESIFIQFFQLFFIFRIIQIANFWIESNKFQTNSNLTPPLQEMATTLES